MAAPCVLAPVPSAGVGVRAANRETMQTVTDLSACTSGAEYVRPALPALIANKITNKRTHAQTHTRTTLLTLFPPFANPFVMHDFNTHVAVTYIAATHSPRVQLVARFTPPVLEPLLHATDGPHQQEMQQVQQQYTFHDRQYDQQQQRNSCGAHSSGVSASTANPRRVPNQHPVLGGSQVYSDPLGDRKVVITAEQLANEDVKPVLQEGEALSEARDFPLNTAEGQSTGLNLEVVWCLHFWAQNNQGIMLEFGCPNNKKEFSEAEIYHSLCALVMRKGYDPKYVMSLDVPTGRRTGP